MTPRETENFIHISRQRKRSTHRGNPVPHHKRGGSDRTAPVAVVGGRLSEMSLRVKSHTDLQTAGTSSLDSGLHKSLSMSSGHLSRGSRFGNGTAGEVKGPPGRCRRPVRVVRPVSTNNSFLQINNLQGELVRKRKVRRSQSPARETCSTRNSPFLKSTSHTPIKVL